MHSHERPLVAIKFARQLHRHAYRHAISRDYDNYSVRTQWRKAVSGSSDGRKCERESDALCLELLVS